MSFCRFQRSMRSQQAACGHTSPAQLVMTTLFLLAVAIAALCVSPGQNLQSHSGSSAAAQPPFGSGLASPTQLPFLANYGALPIYFEPNQGQTDSAVKFVSRGPGYSLFLTSYEAVLALPINASTAADRDKSRLNSGAKSVAV